MWVTGHLDRGVEDILDPRSRLIGFGDGPPQVTVVDALRYAWVKPAAPDDDVGQYLKSISGIKIASEDEMMPEALNLDVDSQWKRNIYHMYNHLFWDISNFLPEVNCAMGHFHPPKESYFPIRALSMQKTFDTNVLLVPAYLSTDCTIEISICDETGTKVKLGSFSMSEPHTVMFLKKDMAVDIDIVHSSSPHDEHALAAVMVVGHLCTDGHGQQNDCIGHSNS